MSEGRPKACGTCSMFDPEIDRCGYVIPDGRGGAARETVRAGTPACDDHHEFVPSREERLEQVALEMWRYIAAAEEAYPLLFDPNRTPGGQIVYPMPSQGFAAELDALGARVDG